MIAITFQNAALDAAKDAVWCDVKPITQAVTAIIAGRDAGAARDLACAASNNRDLWTAEAMMLFNTRGLDIAHMHDMAHAFFGCPVDDALILRAANINARIGKYAFSFPQWRFLTQGFDGPSLIERYGMTKLKRATDVRDPSLPDPQRDEFGTGFVWNNGAWSVEYRRAYIRVTHHSESDPATLVVRNSSYFFGRDRLPHAAYVSREKTDEQILRDATPHDFGPRGRFIPWQQVLPDAKNLNVIHRLLDFVDNFDAHLDVWLRSDGLPHFAAFLKHKKDHGAALPSIGVTDPSMPPWFPKKVFAADDGFLSQLESLSAGKALPEPEIKTLFDLADPWLAGRERMTLLSGREGDLPVRITPSHPAVTAPMTQPI